MQHKNRHCSNPADDNIRAVASLEQSALLNRTRAARWGDAITELAGSEGSVIVHAVALSFWIVVNSHLMPWRPFDPFPFTLLTSGVSLEAIFLTLFVLASQNRLKRETERRARLDLQVNLLAEREMTTLLLMLQELCDHLGLTATTRSDSFRTLVKELDIRDLADRVERQVPTSSS